MVSIVSRPETDEESRFEVEAHIHGKTGSFAIDTPIVAGDYVELPDPRLGQGGVERRYVATAQVLQTGPVRNMHRVKVEWGDDPASSPSRRC